uniref:Uncharacterized protein n=1 Tax=Arundo donax TaxID=35708 RepID=A0A0A9GVC7_ARUDO
MQSTKALGSMEAPLNTRPFRSFQIRQTPRMTIESNPFRRGLGTCFLL